MATKETGGQKQTGRQEHEVEETEAAPSQDVQERNEKLTDDVDAILDEIDEVLEENAEEFVRITCKKGESDRKRPMTPARRRCVRTGGLAKGAAESWGVTRRRADGLAQRPRAAERSVDVLISRGVQVVPAVLGDQGVPKRKRRRPEIGAGRRCFICPRTVRCTSTPAARPAG